ncbi:hypothetical protein KHS38_11420 [Mucilaginibacter sp. Bleaf8]|uniref:hypothetical protein n=1 Tax=Mucilaginibacter sp. Bleaf8 TaxID=2834430 RepID=UPI001BD038C9|nr:hypothetical protein [Mucilaginibacter sp. Bleaf8]MBS7565014.1 hypothetical protein [Mucilaginibacter sp. Bleaf8]
MNKKLFVLLPVLAAFTLTVKAQTQKGNHLLGGGLNANYNKRTTSQGTIGDENYYKYTVKTTTFGIGPAYSYFISDNLDLGINGAYSWQKDSYNDLAPNDSYYSSADKSKYTAFSGGLYLRKYLLYNNKVGFRTGPFVQYQKQRGKTYNGNGLYNDFKMKNFYAGLGLDFVYFPTSKLGLTASMGSLVYNSSKREQATIVDKNDGVGLNFFTNGITLSLVYALGK